MKQQNEMSARALTMEEMENVNGGMLKKIGGIVGRGKFGDNHTKNQSALDIFPERFSSFSTPYKRSFP